MRTFGLACLVVLTLFLPGCGNVFLSGSWNSGKQTVSGFVSVVQFTSVTDGNVTTQVTVVTLAGNSGTTDLSFCGDQRTLFPVDDFVQVTFMPGQPCSNLFSVVIKVH